MEKDGNLRITKLPSLITRIAFRTVWGGQKFTSLVPDDGTATPPSISKKIARRKSDTNGKGAKKKGAAQLPDAGAGPVFIRQYKGVFTAPRADAIELMKAMQADPSRFAPPSLAHYNKTKGKPGMMKVGDEFFITLTGPLNAPVRVAKVSERAFTFVTLDGHMEAGAITFEVRPLIHARHGKQEIEFTVRSWARSRDSFVDFIYDKLKIAQQIQNEMWTSYIESAAKFAGGGLRDNVEISVEQTDDPSRTFQVH